MRFLQLCLFVLAPTLLFSQKMLESDEWSAASGIRNAEYGMRNLDSPTDGRSDSIDILQYNIDLNLTAAPQITAICLVWFQAKVDGISEIRLDLEGLTVDEVHGINVTQLPFTQTGNSLNVTLAQPLNVGQSAKVIVFYHGVPKMDASGWGGFYNTGGYTFNLGVGFASDPHVYGRAWFPCFDNFVERAYFSVSIESPVDKPAYSNGVLTYRDTIPSNGNLRSDWWMGDPIPSYLACFASGPYVTFKRSYSGESGAIPLEIACTASDTNKVKASYIHMPEAIQVFEYWYGPFRWDKIGYSLVPFNSGAMEHATNIAVGRAYIDGSLTYETLWAHELSHHWWGDLATCSTAEDMWLNEGWASYSEHLFTEKLYGQTAFRNAVRANHLSVLQNAHISEGGYLAVSGVPHDLTYGTHVYNKGASVAHNLRGYLGDSLFRVGCRAAMETTSFKDWSSADFRDKLEASTGRDLHDFFNDWVFHGGYPDFSVDSVQYIYSPIDAPTIVRVYVKQKRRGAPDFHHQVPLEFAFVMSDGQRQYRNGIVSGEQSMVEFDFSAFAPAPVSVFLNTRLRLLQARAEGDKMLKTSGGSSFTDARFNLTVNALGADSVLFRVEHHFAAPDDMGANPHGFTLTNRYWSVLTTGASFPPGFDAQAILIYDGKGQGDQLDTELFAHTSPSEDSILLLYRPGAGHAWEEYASYSKITLGSTTDKYGQLRPTHLKAGEYTIAKGVSTVASREPAGLGKIQVSPNPAHDQIRVQSAELFDAATLIAADGQNVQVWNPGTVNETVFDLKDIPPGTYWLMLSGKKGSSVVAFVRQ